MELLAIAAMSNNRVIGKGNKLPWHLPEELAWFKRRTQGHAVLMGRKTFESMGKPLPRRENFVLTHQNLNIPGVTVIHALQELKTDKTIWVIGGAKIYALLLPYCNELYLTHVKMEIANGDAFFPPFEKTFQEKETLEDNELFCIKHYINVKPQKLEAIEMKLEADKV